LAIRRDSSVLKYDSGVYRRCLRVAVPDYRAGRCRKLSPQLVAILENTADLLFK